MSEFQEQNNINFTPDEKRKIRTKIANTVRRQKIDKKCFNCDKEGKIIYDFKNPYSVVFICTQCRKDNNILKEADKYRFNIKDKIESNIDYTGDSLSLCGRQIRWLSNITIEKIIKNYLDLNITVGEYCKRLNISRHQFNAILNRYSDLYPEDNIKRKIKLKMNEVQRNLVIAWKSKNV